MKPRMRCGCCRLSGMGFPLASRGTFGLGVRCGSPWLVSGVDWLVCTTSRENVKSDGPVRLTVEEESDTEVLAARRREDGFGAPSSCTDWALLLAANARQIRVTMKRRTHHPRSAGKHFNTSFSRLNSGTKRVTFAFSCSSSFSPRA